MVALASRTEAISGTYLEEKVKSRPEPQINCFHDSKMGDKLPPKMLSSIHGQCPAHRLYEVELLRIPPLQSVPKWGQAAFCTQSKRLAGQPPQHCWQHKTTIDRKDVSKKKT
jgi:hypothetical protein